MGIMGWSNDVWCLDTVSFLMILNICISIKWKVAKKNTFMKLNKQRFYSKLFQEGQNYSNRRERLNPTPLEQKVGDFQTHLFCGSISESMFFCVFFPTSKPKPNEIPNSSRQLRN